MSSGDFASELRQSVEDGVALVRNAAAAAKARVNEQLPPAEVPPAPAPAQPASIVSFDEVPAFEDAKPPVDAEGIPVWEDPS
jgi:hypothetical protein